LQTDQKAAWVQVSEYSPFTDFQWVAPSYQWFQEIGPSFTRRIFMVLSYWKCDRPEIDFLLRTLSADTELIVANPDPPAAFLDTVEETFPKVKVWRNRPE
jgi:hypothetical protein